MKRIPHSAFRIPHSKDPEATLQQDELEHFTRLDRVLACISIHVLFVVSIPWLALQRLRWRCFTQSQCCDCRVITRRAWLPFRSRRESHRTSYTWCRTCAQKLGIGL